MVTVILLALSTSVGSVISVLPISDVTFAGYLTITTDATFISVILAIVPPHATGRRRVRGQERKGREGGIWCNIATSHVSAQTRK